MTFISMGLRRAALSAGSATLLAVAASSACASATASFSISSFQAFATPGAVLSWSSAADYQTLAATAKDGGGLTGFDTQSSSPASGLANASVRAATSYGSASASATTARTMAGSASSTTTFGPAYTRLNSGEMQGTQSGMFSLSQSGLVTFMVSYVLSVADIGGNEVNDYAYARLQFAAGNYDTGAGDTQTFEHFSYDTASGTATYRGTLQQTVSMTGSQDMGYYQLDGLANTYSNGGATAVTPPVAPVPEPGTYALMLGGLGAVGALVRRRRRAVRKTAAALAMTGCAALLASPAQATLQDRGNGMIYDTSLNITWLKNANFAAGSAFDDGLSKSDGLMSWYNANAWATSLVFGGVGGWRLPTTVIGNSEGFCDFGFSGTDCGYNIDTSHSELAHLFTVDLGNRSALDANGVPRAVYGLKNTGPFTGLSASQYWTNVTFEPNPDRAWNFDMNYGYQTYDFEDRFFYHAFAVHAGDVAGPAATPPPVTAVPEPQTWAMMAAGLLGVGWMRRRALKKATA